MATNSKEENTQLAVVIDMFKNVNEGVAKLFGNKTERKWSHHLLKKYGDKLPKMIAFIPTYNASLRPTHTGRVFGKILKPSHLVEHMQEFIEAKKVLDRKLQFEIELETKREEDRREAKKLKEERDSYTEEQRKEIKNKMDAFKKTLRGF